MREKNPFNSTRLTLHIKKININRNEKNPFKEKSSKKCKFY